MARVQWEANNLLGVIAEDIPVAAVGVIVTLPMGRGAKRYQELAAARLKTIRVMRGFTVEQMATGLTEALGQVIAPRMLDLWESGEEAFMAGLLAAAIDVAGVTEAEVIGLDNPDIETINRLECAIARVRGLLNDPAALTRRAADLLSGGARPLHPVLI
jgi:transcriptional regulator with XRE-family HTH domain